MARRVNDKTIRNVAVSLSATVGTRVVSSASVNAFTHERFIFTGCLRTDDTTAATVNLGILVVHLRGDTIPISNMNIGDDVQMWPDDAAVLYQAYYSMWRNDKQVIPLFIDVKGKRKLRIGDSIQLLYQADVSGVSLFGTLTSFAKLA